MLKNNIGGRNLDSFNIYKDIAERTQGDIYVGVVGPVRTGKSTFIKKFMDLMVIPKIDNNYKKEKLRMSCPQSDQERVFIQLSLNSFLTKLLR